MPQEWDLNRRVVIRKLPENASKGEIEALFGRYGEINNIFVARNPPGFAFIEYVRRRDAEVAAREGNGRRCCGVEVSTELTIRKPDKTIVARNFKQPATKKEIKQVFKSYGQVVRTWIEKTSRSENIKQILTFVEYVLNSEARAAVKALNGKCCWGRTIRVAVCNANATRSRKQPRRTRATTIESGESSGESNSSRKVSSSTSQSNRDACACRGLTNARYTNQRLYCSVCRYNTLKQRPTSTPCGHIFCKTCIESAVQRHGKCPNCRRELRLENLIPMFPSF